MNRTQQDPDWTPDDDAMRQMLALTPKQRVQAMLRIVRFVQRVRPLGSPASSCSESHDVQRGTADSTR